MGVEEVIKWTQLYPGSLGVIGRLTSKALRETTQRRFFEVCPPELIESYNKSEEHLWIRTNAQDEDGYPVYSEILFFHLDEPGPLGSLDISYFWIDEAHEPDGNAVPEETFVMLTARLRHPVGPWRGIVTSNSGGKNWVWDKFFNPKKRAMYSEYIGWSVPTSANEKYLPPGYVDELRKNNPETWVARFLEASFDAFEGQIFLDFDEEIHTYKDGEIDISLEWDFGAGFDFGVSAPTATEFGAIDRDGNIYIYDEEYVADADISKFAAAVRKRGFDHVHADPSVVNLGPDKRSPQELYREEGLYLLPAPNDVEYFLTLFIKLLRERNPDGSARIRINKDKCPNLIEQIKIAAWDPKSVSQKTREKMKKTTDHALDAFKYFLNTYGMSPGLMSPVNPKHKSTNYNTKSWEHESFADDEDYDDPDYEFQQLRMEGL